MHIDHPVAAAPAMRFRRSPGERLEDAVFRLGGGKGRVIRHSEENWASITFTGTRHHIELVFEGEGAIELGEDFIADLPSHEFAIPGQLVADADVVRVDHRAMPPLMKVSCELLLIEEG